MSDDTNTTITAAELAKRLDGRQYLSETTQQDVDDAKAAGLVIVYGQSDDLCEFRGAIHDETGCCDGGTIRFGEDGVVNISDDDADVLKRYGAYEAVLEWTATFDAVWCRDDDSPSWTYDVAFPHETFRVYEGDEVYCVGFVFSLREALEHAESEDGGDGLGDEDEEA